MMDSDTILVETGCRLHFGLLAFDAETDAAYGGVGAMLQTPRLRLSCSAAERFEAEGEDRQRLKACARRFCQYHRLPEPPPCRIRLEVALPAHAGLGSGTQTALAVAAALRAWLRLPPADAETLVAETGRGARSAVGTHGFLHGGLLLDGGKSPGQSLGSLAARVELPESWRVLLIRPPDIEPGRHGPDEKNAFARVPPVPAARRRMLWDLAETELLPAARRNDFPRFAEAVYRYGHEAGLSFAPVQGGPFASPRLAEQVAWLRSRGIAGAGQSSWGPTLFAWFPDAEQAAAWAAELPRTEPFRGTLPQVAAVCNRGARILIEPAEIRTPPPT